MKRLRDRAIKPFAIFAVSFFVQFLLMDRQLGIYDEGIPLTGGMLSASGWMIYRDYYANYGPAQFNVLGWLLSWIGPHIIVGRMYDLAIRSGIVVAMYALLRRRAGNGPALTAATFILLWLACDGPSGYPAYPALLMALISSEFLLRQLNHGNSQGRFGTGMVTSGVLAGICALFRFDTGAALITAHGMSLLYVSACQETNAPRQAAREFCQNILIYLAGVGLMVLPVLAYFTFHGAFDVLWHNTVYFPYRNYVRTRSLPWIGLESMDGLMGIRNMMVYFPAFALLLTGLTVSRRWRPAKARRGLFLFACLMVPLATKGLVRISIVHMQPPIVLSIGSLAFFWGASWRRLPGIPRKIVIVGSLFLGATTLDLLMARVLDTRILVMHDVAGFLGAWQEGISFGTLEMATRSDTKPMFVIANDRYEAIEIIDRCAKKSDTVYLGRNAHDRIVVNDVISYFLLHRKPATRWHHFDPGLQSSQRIQNQMIVDLERNKPPYLWLDSTGNQYFESNESALSSGVTLLDDYIRANYRTIDEVGYFKIMQRAGIITPFGCP